MTTTTTTVLVHEWVTGGGLAGQSLPASWAAEGHAMRRALARDFAALPGVRVVVTLDERLPKEPGPWTTILVGPGEEEATLARLVEEKELDYILPIAPETGGTLARLARMIEQLGGRSLGSSSSAIEATGDKLRLGRHLAGCGIATPDCRRVVPSEGLPSPWTYPAVLKPIDGAGSLDTYFIEDPGVGPDEARSLPVALLQPWIPGQALSASFLVDANGRARLVAVGRQHIEVRDGRLAYRGGTVPVPSRGGEGPARRAVESVPGLLGFVGVDYVWNEAENDASVVEINPRPTTSCVGLTQSLAPGRLAGAWLRAVAGASGFFGRFGPEFAETEFSRSVTFTADGGRIEPGDGASPHA